MVSNIYIDKLFPMENFFKIEPDSSTFVIKCFSHGKVSTIICNYNVNYDD